MQNLIDELTLDFVQTWLPERSLEWAREDVVRGRVSKPAVKARRIDAFVADARRGRVKVSLYLAGGKVRSACDCLSRSLAPCRHAAAVALLLTGAERFESWQIATDPGAADGDLTVAERERRRLRGESDLFEVAGPAGGVYGRYSVGSPSARSYEVVLRALDRPHNGCTCPDFETNLLGTCKHVEAALHHARRRDRRAFDLARDAGPPASYLFVAAGEQAGVGLRLVGQVDAPARAALGRLFHADGLLAGDLAEVWPDVEAAACAHEVEVPAEVWRLAARVRSLADRRRRQAETEREVLAAGAAQPGFRATLYPYQVEGVAFLASRKRALLADDMGLGKTAQAIAAMARLMRKDGVRRTLVVCPASLKHQWEREIHRFTALTARQVTVVGGPREVRRQQYADARDVLIVGYELARTDFREIEAYGPDLLILDEAQRIKNWRTITASQIKRIAARYAFVLTGTPLENRLDDLYSLMQAVDQHVLGPLWKFNADFSHLDERGRPIGYKHLDRLRERLAPVMLRRRKEDVLTQLPPQIVNRLLVPMTIEQQAIHADAEHQVSILLAILKRRPLNPREEQRLMRAFQRMRMACDSAGLVDKETQGAPKLTELESLLDEICIQGGRKVVVFSEWERMQAMAAQMCDRLGIVHVCLNGGVPAANRGALIDRFREDPRCKVFLSTDAGGVGLNLQAASYLINLDLPWNPAVLGQRIARIHRIGQTEPVNVVLLVSEDSFEERMEQTLSAKRSLFEAVVGDDTATTEVARASMASKIATLLSEAFAAATGPAAPAEELALACAPGTGEIESLLVEPAIGPVPGLTSAVPAPGGPGPALPALADRDAGRADALAEPQVARLVGLVGRQLIRVLRLRDGQLACITAGEPPAPLADGAMVLSAAAAQALACLGAASPLAGAAIVHEASGDAIDPLLEARRGRLAAGERKLAAAAQLVAGGMAGEALPLLRDALALAFRALDERGDPGESPAALMAAVYGHLLPTGAIVSADVDALARAGEWARIFADSDVAVPPAMLDQVTREATDALSRARERLGAVAARAG
ncbi:MAG: DEAD/DEAH box helicase [Candidatus Sericytochromatia bacterium]|nr:DEAD/DEAH box helicase [Candidatus Tanganyikabacteria bacterium]